MRANSAIEDARMASAATRETIVGITGGGGQQKPRQFTARPFGRCCRRHGIRRRFGAVGKYGSLAVIQRFIRTSKDDCTRRLVVLFRSVALERELSLFVVWYNADRPHETLHAQTPDEAHFGRSPACLAPRVETRPR
jgi:transposase InsO family protein